MINTVHPFPARMAPDLALSSLLNLSEGCTILDPMSGSGTVLRQAIELGHTAIGLDMDPLAVLMSRVWTSSVSDDVIDERFASLMKSVRDVDPSVSLPWIDDDVETRNFIEFWFGQKQISCLRRISFVLNESINDSSNDILRLALSRIIVTKEQGASLARDTSHSRPHRVALTSDYDVLAGYEKSVKSLRRRLSQPRFKGVASVELGDARCLTLESDSIDAAVTSPPYLNAIDYMRGHRMALVWLGYSLIDLRAIRSNSIGSERAPDTGSNVASSIRSAIGETEALPRRYQSMIDRYVGDVERMTAEIARVLKPGGLATFVVGNSCLKGVYIKNAEAVSAACQARGLHLQSLTERELPNQSRYLPVSTGALAKRMRSEVILTFEK